MSNNEEREKTKKCFEQIRERMSGSAIDFSNLPEKYQESAKKSYAQFKLNCFTAKYGYTENTDEKED